MIDTISSEDKPKIEVEKPKPKVILTKEVNIKDLHYLYHRLRGLTSVATSSISTGNATGLNSEVSAILKEYQKRLLK